MDKFITIGPMFHVNFCESGIKYSLGIEISYWAGRNDNLLGLNLGFDKLISKSEPFVLYSEFQVLLPSSNMHKGFFNGLSIGPNLSISHNPHIGIQGSVWAEYLLGADLRFKHLNNASYFSFGAFGKCPVWSNTIWYSDRNRSEFLD